MIVGDDEGHAAHATGNEALQEATPMDSLARLSTDITHQMLLHSAALHEQLNDMILTARACDI